MFSPRPFCHQFPIIFIPRPWPSRKISGNFSFQAKSTTKCTTQSFTTGRIFLSHCPSGMFRNGSAVLSVVHFQVALADCAEPSAYQVLVFYSSSNDHRGLPWGMGMCREGGGNGAAAGAMDILDTSSCNLPMPSRSVQAQLHTYHLLLPYEWFI